MWWKWMSANREIKVIKKKKAFLAICNRSWQKDSNFWILQGCRHFLELWFCLFLCWCDFASGVKKGDSLYKNKDVSSSSLRNTKTNARERDNSNHPACTPIWRCSPACPSAAGCACTPARPASSCGGGLPARTARGGRGRRPPPPPPQPPPGGRGAARGEGRSAETPPGRGGWPRRAPANRAVSLS